MAAGQANQADAAKAEPASGLAPGTLVADRYRVECLLGEGGMGAVYRAEHVHMRKAVALKVLHPDAGEFPEVVARFEREAIAAANINHPNVVSATDFGKLPDGSFFLVLEYVDGDSLRDMIARGPMSEERALHVIREIASALVVAHKSGVVHRDLKPENIMLVARGTGLEAVKVFDFGIAKIDVSSVTGKSGNTLQPITRVGTIFGTPDYMAPEQAMGQPVDGRADLYALGVMLFEMLTGSRPFKGGAVTLMRSHILQEVPALPDGMADTIDPRLSVILGKLLAKDPGGRYPSAVELVDALSVFGQGQASSAPPPARSTPSGAPGGIVDPEEAKTLRTPTADKSYRPVAHGAYSAQESNKRKRRLAAFGVVFIALGAFLTAIWAMTSKPAPKAGPRTTSVKAVGAPEPVDPADKTATADKTDKSEAKAESSAEPAPIESATPVAASATSEAKPADSTVKLDEDPPPPAPTPVRAAAPEKKDPPPKSGAKGRGTGKPRRTGPGGLYIPPPKDWLK